MNGRVSRWMIWTQLKWNLNGSFVNGISYGFNRAIFLQSGVFFIFPLLLLLLLRHYHHCHKRIVKKKLLKYIVFTAPKRANKITLTKREKKLSGKRTQRAKDREQTNNLQVREATTGINGMTWTTSTENSKQIVRRSVGILCVAVVFWCNFKVFLRFFFSVYASFFSFHFSFREKCLEVEREREEWRGTRFGCGQTITKITNWTRRIYTHSNICHFQRPTDRESAYKTETNDEKQEKQFFFYNAQYVHDAVA